jgi:hypothetical protein
MPARRKSSDSRHATAKLGFKVTIPRSPQGNRWLAADSRSAPETADGNRSNHMDVAEPERSRDSQAQAARRASEARQYKHVVLGQQFQRSPNR